MYMMDSTLVNSPYEFVRFWATAYFAAVTSRLDGVKLDRWSRAPVSSWLVDDVLGWMIAVAKRLGWDLHDMFIHRFADCSGLLLLQMSRQDFLSRDPNNGSTLYDQFWLQVAEEQERLGSMPSTSYNLPASVTASQMSPAEPPDAAFLAMGRSPSSDCSSVIQRSENMFEKSEPMTDGERAADSYSRISTSHQQAESPESSASTSKGSPPENKPPPELRIKKAPSKPRKRTAQNRGNKLWEFIRDMLRDSETCPSVVRWEDPEQGVFRIVESEKLARLWGQRKNNQKMTYEKLSRAMRTYYDKKILVPVPKTGLYPKKLVYKFGPLATGWSPTKGPDAGTSKPTNSVTDKVKADAQPEPGTSDSDIDVVSLPREADSPHLLT